MRPGIGLVVYAGCVQAEGASRKGWRSFDADGLPRAGRGLSAVPAPSVATYASAQQEILAVLPDNAKGVLTIAQPDVLLGGLRALRAVASVGPSLKGKIDEGLGRVTRVLGFDPLDDAAWVAHGLDPKAPMGFAGR